MKYLFIPILLAFFLTSCENLFKEDEQNTFTLSTAEDYDIAMAGLYNRLFNSLIVEITHPGGIPILIESIGNGDDILPIHPTAHYSGTKDPEWPCDRSDLYDLNSNYFNHTHDHRPALRPEDFTHTYKLLYQTIGSANEILFKAGDIDKLEPAFRKIIGEVYFVRAYSYFRLVRVYGQVPIVTDTDVNFTLAKPNFDEIYSFIESDLLKAMGLLPTSNNEARIPYTTPHRGTAKSLLAEVYLTMGGYPLYDDSKYAASAKTAGEVIDSADYFGFGLMPDLAGLWNGKHVKNQESVFSIYFGQSGDLHTFLPANFHPISVNSSPSRYQVPADFFNSFPESYRKKNTFHTRYAEHLVHYVLVNGGVIKTLDTIFLANYDSISYCEYVNYKKFYFQFSVTDYELLSNPRKYWYRYYTGQVVYILRYAQTLLTYAEAKARSGAVDASAYEAINQVRRRANKVDLFSPSAYDLKPGLTAEQFADSVVQERAWELCGEPEGRWFDMVRLEIAKDLVKIKHHQFIIVYPIAIDRNTYFIPIPEEDRILNPNLE